MVNSLLFHPTFSSQPSSSTLEQTTHFSFNLKHKSLFFFLIPPRINPTSSSLSNNTKISCLRSSIMETNPQLTPLVLESAEDKYSNEFDVAVKAVQMACSLCQRVQQGLISKTNSIVQSKDDNSLVTIADWSVQATISWILSESFGSTNVSIVAEEDVEALSKPEATDLLDSVVQTVNQCLAEAPQFGIKGPLTPLNKEEVLDAIRQCNSIGGSSGRFWVLDPVDGTLGFVRGDQYAVALALVEDGEVVLGVLGCPNYPLRKEWLSYHQRYYRIISKLTPPNSESWDKGFVLCAKKGSGKAWMEPLLPQSKLVCLKSPRPIYVSHIEDPAMATFCEPVERANSSHSFTAGLAHSVGVRKEPLRVYSMVKYAAVARGDAEIFMKFARSGYKEKIWDHAAGTIIIQEAGGVVTDAGGQPLDFSNGIYLEGLDRGIIACAGVHLHERIIRAVDASWDSSCL
ncbi:PAP-specific phosphatase HAL2-like [Bienertia sinuspersici]